MPHKYAQIAFTDSVRQVQIEQNSRSGYAKMDQGEDYNYLMSQNEADFITERDSFYMASVSETHWPYLQHRGGPKGFMRVIDESTLGFADFSGNKQYVSTGNFRTNDRVALFFMDYPNKRRLKLMGRIKLVPNNDWETLAKLEVEGYRANVERAFLIHVEAFDWNCPQHITPRFTEEDLDQLLTPLVEENEKLKQQVKGVQSFTQASTDLKETNAIGDGELSLVISGIRQLTPRVRAYEFRDPNGKDLPGIEAGSHLQIPVRLKNGKTVQRHYSICSNPRRRDIYEIAVLKDENGQGGSIAVHETFQLGMQLNCRPPENYFPLHKDDRPAVLFAGGIVIAKGFVASGLSEMLGQWLASLAAIPIILMILVICLVVTYLTEITSNTATATLLLPILAAAAIAIEQDPLVFMIPATICARCAFMLPVATAPNAIAYGTGLIDIKDMVREGFILSLLTVFVVTGVSYLMLV